MKKNLVIVLLVLFVAFGGFFAYYKFLAQKGGVTVDKLGHTDIIYSALSDNCLYEKQIFKLTDGNYLYAYNNYKTGNIQICLIDAKTKTFKVLNSFKAPDGKYSVIKAPLSSDKILFAINKKQIANPQAISRLIYDYKTNEFKKIFLNGGGFTYGFFEFEKGKICYAVKKNDMVIGFGVYDFLENKVVSEYKLNLKNGIATSAQKLKKGKYLLVRKSKDEKAVLGVYDPVSNAVAEIKPFELSKYDDIEDINSSNYLILKSKDDFYYSYDMGKSKITKLKNAGGEFLESKNGKTDINLNKLNIAYDEFFDSGRILFYAFALKDYIVYDLENNKETKIESFCKAPVEITSLAKDKFYVNCYSCFEVIDLAKNKIANKKLQKFDPRMNTTYDNSPYFVSKSLVGEQAELYYFDNKTNKAIKKAELKGAKGDVKILPGDVLYNEKSKTLLLLYTDIYEEGGKTELTTVKNSLRRPVKYKYRTAIELYSE